MNTTSKIIIALSVALLSGCPQGPWDFWPKDPELYRGVWTTAHVVSGRPLESLCFEPVIPLTWTRTPNFAFYDSAHVEVSGRFSGSQQTFVLNPRSDIPNCFDGPADQLAEAGATYNLSATFVWDSLGQQVQSTYSSTTTIPTRFRALNLRSPALTRPNDMLQDPALTPLLAGFLPEDTNPQDLPAELVDSLIGTNQLPLWGITKDIRYNTVSGDTVRSLNVPLDLQSHFVNSEYTDDVRGVLMTIYFDSTQGKPATTFDYFGGFQPDSAEKWEKGNRHRIFYLQSAPIPGGQGNLIDSISLSNAYLYVGTQTIFFYGAEQIYTEYIANSIQGSGDSRIRPRGNIEGGEGIFAGLVVDSIVLTLKPYPSTVVFPYQITKIMGCREYGWFNELFPECRTYLTEFCVDSLSTAPDCRIHAVAQALDSGWTWDSLMVEAEDATQSDSVQREGSILHCLHTSFIDNSTCQTPIENCLVSADKNLCKTRLWQYCEERGWPIDSLEYCGTGLVSWARLNNKISAVLDREIEDWCNEHPADQQCELR